MMAWFREQNNNTVRIQVWNHNTVAQNTSIAQESQALVSMFSQYPSSWVYTDPDPDTGGGGVGN